MTKYYAIRHKPSRRFAMLDDDYVGWFLDSRALTAVPRKEEILEALKVVSDGDIKQRLPVNELEIVEIEVPEK